MKKSENRKSTRLEKFLSARIQVPCLTRKGESLDRGYEIVLRDISAGGAFGVLNIPESAFVNVLHTNLLKVFLEIKLAEIAKTLKIPARAVWQKDYKDPIDGVLGVGLEFMDLSDKNREVIEGYIEAILKEYKQDSEKKGELPKFDLLIGGKTVDTGKYEYFPYAEQCILDFKGAYRMIRQLKKGETPEDHDKYVFARYSINDDNTNADAIKAAYEASRIYRTFSLEKRRKIMGDIHDLMVANKDKFIELLVIEGHSRCLSEWEFSGMERCLNKESLDFFVSEMRKEIHNGDETILLERKPDGVVCLCPPKNAPSSNSLLASLVFLAGNTIVVKPPLKMPLSTIFLWTNVINEALKRNGAPDGCVNIVLGNSKKIMEEWLESPLVNDIIFFGDSKTGLEIGKQAYLHDKKPILELSGNDLFYVWKDASVDKAISSLLDAFLGSTQICMVPKNAIIHEAIYDSFVNSFIDATKNLKVGLPSSEDTYFTPVGRPADFFDFLEDAVSKGARLLYGGKRIDHTGKVCKDGAYVQPTLLEIEYDENTKDMKVLKEENFFPLIPLIKVKGTDDEIFNVMKHISDLNDYGLRISVWTRDPAMKERFISDLENTGILKVNSRHVAFSMYTSTHGGTRRTGGVYGEMNYVWQKTSHLQGIVIREE